MSSPPLTWARRFFLHALVVALAACGRSPTTTDAKVDSLPVDVVGCAAVLRAPAGPVCELTEARSLHLVVPAGATSVRARAGAEALAVDAGATAKPGDDPLLSLTAPAEAGEIVVDATLAGRPARARIRLAKSAPPPWLDEARGARARNELERAETIAAAHANDPQPGARALAKGLLARIALSRGRADEAFPLFREAIALHRSVDRVSDAVDDSFALAFALHQRSRRYTEARAVLDELGRDVDLYAEGRARAPYYRGTLAAETGDRRQALALLREAERTAHRLGMTKLERNARAALALELLELGRATASLPLLAALEQELDVAAREKKADAPSACERVEIANNRGWAALVANETDGGDGTRSKADARDALERALAIEGCADVYVRGFALSNVARLALLDGDLGTAERRLAEARAGVKEPRGTERVEWLELEARILLARGKARDALRVLDDALALARASVLRPQEWSVLVARADALVTAKRTPDAIASLRAAEDVLDDALLLVPLGEGRGAFAGGRSRSARALVGLLVREGKNTDAAQVAERAGARVLASALGAVRLQQLSPDQRARWEEIVRSFREARASLDAEAADDWKLPADALARAVKGRTARERELRDALERAMTIVGGHAVRPEHHVEEGARLELDVYRDLDGYLALVRDGADVVTHRLPDPSGLDPNALAHALLDPIASRLERGTRPVVVRAYGAWRAIDVHALPWQGEPLLAHRSVVYSIGLGTHDASTSGASVVVGDPTGDLPAALEEARSAARALASDAGSPIRLLLREEATSRAVTDALRGAARLHYAGHGVFAGEEGWESALPLAAGGQLTAADILALAPGPESVVLTGCEAAKSIGESEGLGLAQAFLVAGALEVLAPVRRVPDVTAAKLSTALYEASGPLAERGRTAVLRVRAGDPDGDWAAFRVLVP